MTMKILLLGDGAVGKSAIRLRFMDSSIQKRYMMTIGSEFAIKTIKIASGPYKGHTIKAQIWDVAGKKESSTIRSLYYKRSHAAIMVYDCTRIATFDNIKNWMTEFFNSSQHIIPVMLLAYRADLRSSVKSSVSQEEGLKKAQRIAQQYLQNKIEVPYFEISEEPGENLDLAFQTIIDKVINYFT